MRISAYRAIVVLYLLTSLPAVGTAEIRRTGSWEMSFGYSFLFDACGAAEHGRLIRRVITETVARCDFTAAEKEWFHNYAVDSDAGMQARLAEILRQHGGPLERLGDPNVSCEQMRATAAAQHDRLTEYEASELRTVARKCKPWEVLPCPNAAPLSAPPARP
jgi:hypothetical protein